MGCPYSHELGPLCAATGSASGAVDGTVIVGSQRPSNGRTVDLCCSVSRRSLSDGIFDDRTRDDGMDWTGRDPNGPRYGRRHDDNSEPALSAEQRRLIKETWIYMKPNLTAVGKQVFLCIFEFRPSVKHMYSFRDVWGDQLIKHPQFQLQANRFMSVVVGVVESVDLLSSAHCGCPGLVELGRKHVTIKGFLPDYFDVFTRAVLSVWRQELRDSYTADVGDAWAALFGYIISQLKNGYEDEMRVRQLI